MITSRSNSFYKNTEEKGLFFGGLHQDLETEQLIPDRADGPRPTVQSPMQLARELHSKVSLLNSYKVQLEMYPMNCKHLFGWDELLTIKYRWPQMIFSFLLMVLAVYLDCLAQVYIQLHPANIPRPKC